MNVYEKKITVFTPTYNRAYTIEKLYMSLKRQEYTDFEWLIIDDGSTDNTEDLFSKWRKENNNFPIRYYKKENGGKCRAINYALDLAQGELFFTVDSDDYLTDDALEKIAKWERDIKEKEKFCGIAGNMGTGANITVNKIIEQPYLESTALERYHRVDGERAMVFYTDIHKKYKYPEFDGEKFMTEAVAWNRMAKDGYKMRFFNDIIWIYEYKEDGLTKAGHSLFINNPRGYGLWLREKSKYENENLMQRIKMYYSFTCEMQEKYTEKEIACFIGASEKIIKILKILFKFKRVTK